jgi:hypothetical protein
MFVISLLRSPDPENEESGIKINDWKPQRIAQIFYSLSTAET